MPILGLLVIVIYFLFKSASESAESKKKCAQLVDQGAFWKRDYERNNILFHDYYMDWFAGEGEFVPKEYHDYFRRNKEAAIMHTKALTSAQLIKEGLSPIWCGGLYNKYTFEPFGAFNHLYKDKIKIFNETGKLYF